jgi:hypothetical protein
LALPELVEHLAKLLPVVHGGVLEVLSACVDSGDEWGAGEGVAPEKILGRTVVVWPADWST